MVAYAYKEIHDGGENQPQNLVLSQRGNSQKNILNVNAFILCSKTGKSKQHVVKGCMPRW